MRGAYALRLGVAASLVLAVQGCGSAGDGRTTIASAVSMKNPKHCLAATPIDLSAGAATVTGDSTDTSNRHEWCGEGPGTYYTFTLGRPSAVYADTLGSSFDTVVGLLANGCAAPPRSCSDDACATAQSQLFEFLLPGTYHLLVAGRSAEDRGPFVLHVQATASATPPAGEIGRGPFELRGSLASFQGGWLGDCGRGPFVWYWYLSCPGDSGFFTASTCNADTSFDAALSFVDVDDGEEVCCDEAASGDPLEACAGEVLDEFPEQAAVRVWDEPEAGLHLLKVGAVGVMSVPQGEFLIVGQRP